MTVHHNPQVSSAMETHAMNTNLFTIEGITIRVPECPPDLEHLIPPDEPYTPRPEWLRLLALGFKNKRPVLFVGDAGTGKDATIRAFFRAIRRPLLTVSMTEGITTDHLIGATVPVPVEPSGFTVEWRDGVLAMAIKRGIAVNLSEISMSDSRVSGRLHEFFANEFALFIPENLDDPMTLLRPYDENGEHNGFAVVGSYNEAESGMYNGTGEVNAAFTDRAYRINTNYIGEDDPEAEAEVLVNATGCETEVATKLVTVFNMVRKRTHLTEADLASGTAPMYCVASTRSAIKIAEASIDLPIMEAAAVAWLNNINPQDRIVCERLLQEQFLESDNPFLADEAASTSVTQ